MKTSVKETPRITVAIAGTHQGIEAKAPLRNLSSVHKSREQRGESDSRPAEEEDPNDEERTGVHSSPESFLRRRMTVPFRYEDFIMSLEINI